MLPKVAQATVGAEPQGHGPSTIIQGLGEQGGRPGSREQQPGPTTRDTARSPPAACLRRQSSCTTGNLEPPLEYGK